MADLATLAVRPNAHWLMACISVSLSLSAGQRSPPSLPPGGLLTAILAIVLLGEQARMAHGWEGLILAAVMLAQSDSPAPAPAGVSRILRNLPLDNIINF